MEKIRRECLLPLALFCNYEEYTAAIENEMQTYFANQAQVSATAFEPLIGKFNAAFSDALTEAQPAFDRPVEDLLDRTFHQFTTDETGVLVGDSISDFMRSVDQQWKLGFQTLDITPEVRAALSETLAALEPRAEQLQKIADDSRAAGIAVPQYVSEGLHDYNMLAAISGDMDAINYLLGEKLSTDPNFLQALQTATDAGMNINEAVANGLLDNLEVERDLSRGNFLLTISLFVLTSLSQGNIINTELNNDFCGHLHILL